MVLMCLIKEKFSKPGKVYTDLYRCKCGTYFLALRCNVGPKGHTKSCGCLRIRSRKTQSITHGHATNFSGKAYSSWAAMKQRVLNQNHHAFYRYGGRGIKICDRWLKFENFLTDMGERPKNTTLDRIDPNGNYEPGNCRWATWEQQANNKRPKTRATSVRKIRSNIKTTKTDPDRGAEVA